MSWQAVRAVDALEMPLESLTDTVEPIDEWRHQYGEHKEASTRVVTMFKEANYSELSKFLKSKKGAQWAAMSIGLGKGKGRKGR